MTEFPSGIVTLLFTGIEGSTRLLERAGDAYLDLLAEHRLLLRTAFERHRGVEVDTEGDAFFVAFASAKEAVAAATDAQRALAAHAWPNNAEIRVRVGIHTGEPRLIGRSYIGLDVHRAARVMAAGHGGQVLVSGSTRKRLDRDVSLLDLGEHRLKDLLQPEHLYQLRIEGLPSEFPGLRTLGNRPTNLPTQPNQLIGREHELRKIGDLLRSEDVRLLTLTGTGGTGKTRLALQTGAELLDKFASGVFFVSLSPIRDPDLVLPTIAQTLAVREVPGEQLADTLASYLEEKELLLLLDNFEQVVAAAAVVARLLAKCPKLKALVTSRERLRIAAERIFEVPPLMLPEQTDDPDVLVQNEAAALFLARAQAAKPDFELTQLNAAAVREVCARLEGLPLAIELAAARIPLLPPEGLLRRLDERLKLLTMGSHEADERQQTLRRTIEWSYDLLSGSEQALFRRLSVFVDGCRLGAAEAVCDTDGDLGVDLVDGLQSLLEKSLLRRRQDPDGELRCWMLETIREFARETLREASGSERYEARHALAYLSLGEHFEKDMRQGAEQGGWIQRLDADYANLRAALTWFARRDPRRELRLASALAKFWSPRGYLSDGCYWLEDALTRCGEASQRQRAVALTALAGYMQLTGHYASMKAHAEASVSLYSQLGEQEGTARATRLLARAESFLGNTKRAKDLLKQAIEAARGHDQNVEVARFSRDLGVFNSITGDLVRAEQLFEGSLRLFVEADDVDGTALCHYDIGGLLTDRGEHREALRHLRESLTLFMSLGNTFMAVNVLMPVAAALAPLGESERAARLLAYAQLERGRMGFADEPQEEETFGPLRLTLEAALGENRLAEVSCQAEYMTLEDAVAQALDKEESSQPQSDAASGCLSAATQANS